MPHTTVLGNVVLLHLPYVASDMLVCLQLPSCCASVSRSPPRAALQTCTRWTLVKVATDYRSCGAIAARSGDSMTLGNAQV